MTTPTFFVHPSAIVDEPTEIGEGTKIWHFSHISAHTRIGAFCSFGQNVFVASGVLIGSHVKVQNNVSLYAGVEIEDEVFLGPSCVLTNVSNPRSQINRQALYEKTLIRRGASIGANATIVCGKTIGAYAFVGAGAVVTHDVPAYALMLGTPAKQVGWMSRHGHRLSVDASTGLMRCPESGLRYQLKDERLVCLDLDDNQPLPAALQVGQKRYTDYKT